MFGKKRQRLSITDLGSTGIVPDQTPQALPTGAFTDGSYNVRFRQGEVQSFPGHEVVTLSGAETGIVFVKPVRASTGQQGLLLCTLTNIYEYYADSTDTVTRVSGAYSWTLGSTGHPFTGTDFHGVPVINQYLDYPQVLKIGASDFVDMDWDSGNTWADVTTKCRFVRTFKNLLVAGYFNVSGTKHPQRFRWSAIAEEGGVPVTWDEDDTTELAGVHDLMDTSGPVLDAVPMGETLVIYKSDAVYRADYVGAPFMFDFNLLTTRQGIVNTNCVVDIGGPHIVWLRSGPAMFDGSDLVPIGHGRVKEELAADAADYAYAFLAHNQGKHEVWFCYNADGAAYAAADTAWVYNYADRTWSKTELPTATTWLVGGVDNIGSNIGDQVGIYPFSWQSSPTTMYGAAGGSSTGVLGRWGEDPDDAGSVRTCLAERRGLVLGGLDEVHMVTAIWPHMSGDPVTVYLGTQNHPEGSVTYDAGTTFTPGTDRKVDVRGTGAVHAVKFQSATKGAEWVLTGYDVEFAPVGRRPTG